MKNLDEILEFLFHSKTGKAVSICAVSMLSFASGGCFLIDSLACGCYLCGDTETADCLWECDDSCNDVVACGGDCEDTLWTALFGEGCTKDCGDDCGVWTLNCNPSDCGLSCGGGCDSNGCDDSVCQLFGCTVECGMDPLSHSIRIIYYDVSENTKINERYWTIYENQSWTYIDPQYMSSGSNYQVRNGFYTTYSEGAGFTGAYADATGQITSSISLWDIDELYALCEENYAGNRCDLTFYPTVDGKAAEEFAAFDDVAIPKYSATVGARMADFPNPPDVEGFTFEGWYYNGQKKELSSDKIFHLYDFSNTGISTLSIEARYTSTKIEVSLQMTEGGEKLPYTVTYGTTVQQFVEEHQAQLTQPNKKLAGFYTEGEKWTGMPVIHEGEFATCGLTATVTLRPKYLDAVEVIYYGYYGPRDNRTYKPETVYYENDFYMVEAPSAQEIHIYNFVGWYKQEACTDEWESYIYVSKETPPIFYAKWNAVTNYEISYYDSDTGSTPIVKTDYTYSADSPTELINLETYAPSLVPAGHTFVGWYFSDDASKTPMTELPADTYGNLHLRPIWRPKSYQVSFNANNGTVSPTTSIIYHSQSYVLPVPTRYGYDFQGWYYTDPENTLTDENGVSKSPFDPEMHGVSGNFPLFAKWAKHEYTVTFKDNGNTVKTVKREYETALGTVDGLVYAGKMGYQFVGWFNGNVEYNAETQIVADCVYEAVYEPIEYTVTLDYQDGLGTSSTVKVKYGQKINLGVPTRAGYSFLGWYKSSTFASGSMFADYEGNMSQAYTETIGITLYARWVQV